MQPIIIKLFKFGEDILIYLRRRIHDTLCMEHCPGNKKTGGESIWRILYKEWFDEDNDRKVQKVISENLSE